MLDDKTCFDDKSNPPLKIGKIIEMLQAYQEKGCKGTVAIKLRGSNVPQFITNIDYAFDFLEMETEGVVIQAVPYYRDDSNINWKERYDELNEYVERTYKDY